MNRTKLAPIGALLLVGGLGAGMPADAEVAASPERIVVTGIIQQAVDAAQPGDTVVVPPGVYHESVAIHTSGITLIGSRGAVIDASGFSTGITAVSNPAPPRAPCPAATLTDITIRGLTVRDASFTGVFMRGVDGFEISGGRYLDDGLYGVFPVCSQHGIVSGNEARGTRDAALYVGNSDEVTLTGNQITDSTVGVEVENSTHIEVTDNRITGNSAGIIAFVLPGLAIPVTDEVLIAENVVSHNNRSRDRDPGVGPVDLVPTGTGVLSFAADHVTISGNRVIGNDTGGIGVLAKPDVAVDPRVDPEPDFNRVIGNVVLRNGLNPDPLRPRTPPVPGADLIYDRSGEDNCFAANVFGTEFPIGITAEFSCEPWPTASHLGAGDHTPPTGCRASHCGSSRP